MRTKIYLIVGRGTSCGKVLTMPLIERYKRVKNKERNMHKLCFDPDFLHYQFSCYIAWRSSVVMVLLGNLCGMPLRLLRILYDVPAWV